MLKVMLLMMKKKKCSEANNFLSYPKQPQNTWEGKKLGNKGRENSGKKASGNSYSKMATVMLSRW